MSQETGNISPSSRGSRDGVVESDQEAPALDTQEVATSSSQRTASQPHSTAWSSASVPRTPPGENQVWTNDDNLKEELEAIRKAEALQKTASDADDTENFPHRCQDSVNKRRPSARCRTRQSKNSHCRRKKQKPGQGRYPTTFLQHSGPKLDCSRIIKRQ